LAIAISEEFENMELAEPKYRIWMQENSDSEFAQFLKKQYLNHQKTRKGKPAPKLALKDRNGKLIALSDFLGKVVYLEFWASWCGPCIMEAPNFKKLYSSFAPKGVVFLSVSIDENENLWLKMLDKLKIPGFHVRAKGRTDSNILNYSVNGIPRYFCIGKNGEIVDSNAPSPSQLEIGTLLDSELKK
jgi:thiol-disulfide isomerase/thioredoxin